ncbi:U6 snRNP complex subunit PRP24 NDAI_0K00510 [Naumovozyma dairenensis CBS 421]|uniref:RRM domain-containing protein n=1 Tax=Naumovozyma dairenensis (strain ATCC 10597 / BCRC 20456 / CBS 421 / NBRC 0211 / NRRL Y-12639) TaxID=1071378 RepID=G0WHI1_NAUDC|nr:hypothetical protein NDAI_0K00510 [Naumovozyma dairenensis CBS 421]CCD27242.1 hypothetical protein NDAI_0K00510 [Naumovozyma dairenensis CBS 421]
MSNPRKRSVEEEENSIPQGISKPKKQNDTETKNRELTTVLVKNLPKSANQTKMHKFFQDCGIINHIDIVDSNDKKSRLARLEFSTFLEASSALTKTFKKVGPNNIIEVTSLHGCTIWMTNFPPSFEAKNIRQLIQDETGMIVVSIRLPSLKYNSNRRFAYIDLCSKEDAQSVIQNLNNMDLNGYKLVVKISNPSDRSKRTDLSTIERREIIIRNLNPMTLTEEKLRNHFGECGEIERITIPHRQRENVESFHNGCAFIVFSTATQANNALELNKSEFLGREISVGLADKKPYLERKEVKRLLHSKNTKELARIISLYPLSDRVTKSNIKSFLHETFPNRSVGDEMEDIYLVSDKNGAFIILKDEKLAGIYLMGLNMKMFHNKVIHCGTVNDLKGNANGIHLDKKQNNNNNNKINTIEKKPSKDILKAPAGLEKEQSQKKLSNDDFRRMFLGK